jgi:hypothetical protein
MPYRPRAPGSTLIQRADGSLAPERISASYACRDASRVAASLPRLTAATRPTVVRFDEWPGGSAEL